MRAINQWREFMLERDISPTARLIGFVLLNTTDLKS